MICISIAQKSRRLALADLLNAARMGDMLEVRLDCFDKAPDFGDLFAAQRKPMILTCRRTRDGGEWDGSEEERLALLRQGIISKANYVEIELDVADQIRPFPGVQRVISYTNLRETPEDIADIYAEARGKKPDVIKLTTLARTPEEAWPLVQILAKSSVPTVVGGLGKPGIMLAVLGKKIGAPWTYAALERGMETSPGQPTINDLETIYHYRSIERTTRLIGVTGFDESATMTVAALNAVLAHFQLPARCWPMTMGNPQMFRKIVEAVKLAAVVVDEEHQGAARTMATKLDAAAEQFQATDLLLHKENQWHGYQLQGRAAVAALETAMRTKGASEHPLKGRVVLIVGANALAGNMARAMKAEGAILILAGRERGAVQKLAHDLECRYIQFEAIYTTNHDVVVVCDEGHTAGGHTGSGGGIAGVHTGYLKPGMTVLDLTALGRKSALLREAELRGCAIVSPRQLLLDRIALQARMLTGKETPREVLTNAIPEDYEDE